MKKFLIGIATLVCILPVFFALLGQAHDITSWFAGAR
jgi:hypothetical protein